MTLFAGGGDETWDEKRRSHRAALICSKSKLIWADGTSAGASPKAKRIACKNQRRPAPLPARLSPWPRAEGLQANQVQSYDSVSHEAHVVRPSVWYNICICFPIGQESIR